MNTLSVDPSALAVHADGDAVRGRGVGEVGISELRPLVGVEDCRSAAAGQRLLQGGHTEAGVHRVRRPLRQHLARERVDDRHQIAEAAGHR